MSIDKLPFTEPGALEPEALSDYYQELHASPHSTFYDKGTGAFVIWRHVDVATTLSGQNPAIGNRNTLDPLDSKLRLATNPRTYKSLAQLMLNTTPATANAPAAVHEQVLATVQDEDSNLSLNRRHFTRNYGSVVLDAVEGVTHDLWKVLHRDGVADFSQDFAKPLATRVIGDILGFSRQEQVQIQAWSDAQTSLLGRHLKRTEQGSALDGLANLALACRGLIQARREYPKLDLASQIASEKHELSDNVATSTLMNLVAAGYATTYGTIQNSMRYLSTPEGREHWHLLSDPEYTGKLAPELLRLETGLIGWKRYAEKSVKLHNGEVIPSGNQIIALLGAANRDPAFQNPNSIDLARPNRPKHLSFGMGRHLCMGRELAMIEITAALVALRTEMPTLTIEENSEAPITYEPDNLFRTIQSMPVRR